MSHALIKLTSFNYIHARCSLLLNKNGRRVMEIKTVITEIILSTTHWLFIHTSIETINEPNEFEFLKRN